MLLEKSEYGVASLLEEGSKHDLRYRVADPQGVKRKVDGAPLVFSLGAFYLLEDKSMTT